MTIQLQIYINDQLVDVSPGTVMAKTIQAFDLFSPPGTVRANYTNQFALPMTSNNQRIFQFVDNVKSKTNYPYIQLPARVIQNGVEIIGSGIAIIQTTDTAYNINIYDGNYEFFNRIINLKLWDIDLSPLDQNWQVADIDNARNTTSGVVAALINFGQLIASGTNIDAVTNGFRFMPSVYYQSIVDRLFKGFGYTYSGNIFSNPKYLKLIVPCRNTYSDPFCSAKEFCASAPGTDVFVSPVNPKVTFNQVSLNGSDNFYDGVNTYTVVNPHGSNPYFICNFQALINFTVTGTGHVNFTLWQNGVAQVVSPSFPVGANQTCTLQVSGISMNEGGSTALRVKNGDTFFITASTVGGAPTVAINSGTFLNHLPQVGDSNSTNVPFADFNGCFLEMKDLLPDMLITDFLQDFALRFGLLFTERKGQIIARNVDELINDTGNAVDWTLKRDKSVTPQNSFQFANFAQLNWFKNSNQADSTLDENFASSNFPVPNSNLDPENIYTSPFNGSTTLATLGQYMAQAIIWDQVNLKYIADIDARLLLVRDALASDPQVQFNTTMRSDYKVAYFLDGKQPYQMNWQEFQSNAYTQFLIRMQNAKMVTRGYNLSDLDIINFNPLQLIYDDGAYFIVNQIQNYLPGKTTTVQLFKI
jgi:hypothetical protein